MEENKHCTDGKSSRLCCACGAAPFLIGVLVALAFGWWIFPDLIFSKQSQPFFFSHAVHVETGGMSCADCHSFREDGSFTGIPSLETCAGCHADIMTAEPGPDSGPAEKAAYAAEKFFVEEHVRTGKPIAWKVHQHQPDNVFFSHAAHFNKCFTCHLTMKGKLSLGTPGDPQKLCMTCHPSLEQLDRGIPVESNVLTDYSRTTMKMWQCEACHAHPGHFYNDGKGRTAANNACYTCHK
jgi:hypothetical protein